MDIPGALAHVGIYLTNYGSGGHKARCPKCGIGKRAKRADLSVTISGDSVVWKCHSASCNWTTPTFAEDPEFYQILDPARYGTDSQPKQERQQKVKKAPPKKPEFKPAAMPEKAYAWLEARGISRAVADRNKLSVATKNFGSEKRVCLAFPYTVRGETVNVKYRSPDKKFMQEKDALRVFYGLDSVGDHKAVLVVEGEMDKLACEQAGLDQRMGLLSVPDGAVAKVRDEIPPREEDDKFAFLWNSFDTGLLDRVEKFILALDADGPGQAMTEEMARRLGKERCFIVKWPSANDAQIKDANEVLVDPDCGAKVLVECVEAAQPYPLQNLFRVSTFRDAVQRTLQQGRQRGLSTGFVNLDDLMCLVPGKFYVVTGNPSSGKSEVIDAIAVNAAIQHGWRWCYCSFENDPATDHLPKLAEKYLGMPFWDYPGGIPKMGGGDLDRALDWLEDRFQFIVAQEESPTIDFILDRAKAAVIRDGVKGLVIDPYNEVEQKRPKGMTETEYVSMMIGKCKRFAQAYGVAVFFIAHPSKLQRDKNGNFPIPTLSDISGSQNWWNKADFGIVVNRVWDFERADLSRIADIYVRKVKFRWMGKPGLVHLEYNPVNGRYLPYYPPE